MGEPQRGAQPVVLLPVVAARPDGISMCVSEDVHISRRCPFYVAFRFGLLRLLVSSVKGKRQTVISRNEINKIKKMDLVR